MSDAHPLRRPISTRHAFALAFDLALRRDVVQSMLVPLLLRAPWIVTFVLLLPLDGREPSGSGALLSGLALLGDSVTGLLIGSMQRYRARSVFNLPRDARPAPVLDCYARGLRRLPWLVLTEWVRKLAIGFAFVCFVVPSVFVAYRLSCATEAVVLDAPHLTAAFQRSFRMMDRRFERWIEMIGASVALVIALWFVAAVVSLPIPSISERALTGVAYLVYAAAMPLVQYAWTFFYLRLVEIEAPGMNGEGAAPVVDPARARWALALVEPPRITREGDPAG